MADTLTVTSGKQWRRLREEGASVQLPSGNVAQLRPVSLEELVVSGKIPNPLLARVRSLIGLGLREDENEIDMAERTKEMIDIMKIVCQSAFLNPRIVDDPENDNEISFFDLSAMDRDFVMDWVQGPQRTLEPFR